MLNKLVILLFRVRKNVMSKVLLIYPELYRSPFVSSSVVAVLKKQFELFPPLGILYIGRSLLDAGYEVEAIDFNSASYNEAILLRSLSEKDAVGITTNSFNLRGVDRLISDIRKAKPHIRIVIGGPDVTLHPRVIEGSDLSIAGEAEKTAPAIFDALLNDGDFSKLNGAIYKMPLSKRTVYGKAPYIEHNLDSIKLPARELLTAKEKFQGYNLFGEKYKNRIATMITTRGCPFRCRFCACNTISFKKYRKRSVQSCLEEIDQIHKEGYVILGIVDDNFLSIANRKLMIGIFNGIIERGYKFSIVAEGRVDSALDEQLYVLMRRAGVVAVIYGMESMNQDVLDFYRKGTTVELNRKATQLTYKYGIFSFAYFIIGTPFEDETLIKKMLKDMYSLRLDMVNIGGLLYSYGAPLWYEAKEKGLINASEYAVPAGNEYNLSPLSSSQLSSLSYRALLTFYVRPIYWIRFFQKAMKFDKRTLYFIFRILQKVFFYLFQLR
jgi:radical SAM superfamily enzyme YgiQ (UPF0313 family)